MGESIAGANGQSSRSAGGSDSLDAFLALKDNFSEVDANGGIPLVNGRNFSQDAAARRAGGNPMGLPTYSVGSSQPQFASEDAANFYGRLIGALQENASPP